MRLWLREVFEPAHTAAKIPQRVIDANMANPGQVRRMFHPELWFVCQVLIVPRERGEDGRNVPPPSAAEARARWDAAASSAFSPLTARIMDLRDEIVADEDCSLLGRIVGGSAREVEAAVGDEPGAVEAFTIRFESFAFAPSEAATFDQRWLDEVTAKPEPGLLGPFATQFGLHVVVVTKIEPPSLPDGSLPAKELAAARELELRANIEEAWRADQLQQTLAEIRDRRVVRLASELE